MRKNDIDIIAQSLTMIRTYVEMQPFEVTKLVIFMVPLVKYWHMVLDVLVNTNIVTIHGIKLKTQLMKN